MKPDNYPSTPVHLWRHFYQITQIPRPSRQEAAVRQYVIDQAEQGGADAVLCASIFHYGQHTVREAKERMRDAGIPVRL